GGNAGNGNHTNSAFKLQILVAIELSGCDAASGQCQGASQKSAGSIFSESAVPKFCNAVVHLTLLEFWVRSLLRQFIRFPVAHWNLCFQAFSAGVEVALRSTGKLRYGRRPHAQLSLKPGILCSCPSPE